MSASVPPQLSALLLASDDVTRSRAWAAFLNEYSKLLLQTARRAATSHDDAMDHYTFILEHLRDNDFRRLRTFAGQGRGKFTTWLVVVARRLSVDSYRNKHGRLQSQGDPSSAQSLEQITRRNLADLVAGEIDWERMEDEGRPQPDAAVLREERRTALMSAVVKLDVADQLLLSLRFEDDVPLTGIGPMVGLRSRWQVHRRLKAVLAGLRAGLEANGITER